MESSIVVTYRIHVIKHDTNNQKFWPPKTHANRQVKGNVTRFEFLRRVTRFTMCALVPWACFLRSSASSQYYDHYHIVRFISWSILPTKGKSPPTRTGRRPIAALQVDCRVEAEAEGTASLSDQEGEEALKQVHAGLHARQHLVWLAHTLQKPTSAADNRHQLATWGIKQLGIFYFFLLLLHNNAF